MAQPARQTLLIVWETRAKYLHFSGTNWQMPAWNIAVSSWPRGQEWRQMLQKTLAHLVGGGRVAAWMGTELSAALTDDGRFSCAVDPDVPVVDLDDGETLRLRAYATGLADVE